MNEVWTTIVVILALMGITFLVAWEAAKDKFAQDVDDKVDDAFSEGRRSIIIKLDAHELGRLSYMEDIRSELKLRAEKYSGFSISDLELETDLDDARSTTFRPDVEAAVRQATDLT